MPSMKLRDGVRFLVWGSVLVAACSIKPPEFRVTGEKTALEKEILGTYHQMREDTWMVASTRGPETRAAAPMSPEKKRSLDALQEQAFNRDDVEEFKRNGWIGETNEGWLEVRESADLPRNAERRKFLDDIAREENDDRRVILERVVELNDALKRAVPKDVSAVFAKMYQENSPKGTWIQQPDGTWMKP
jgi:uncharacterized protein YdbL (DUF1318 family)